MQAMASRIWSSLLLAARPYRRPCGVHDGRGALRWAWSLDEPQQLLAPADKNQKLREGIRGALAMGPRTKYLPWYWTNAKVLLEGWGFRTCTGPATLPLVALCLALGRVVAGWECLATLTAVSSVLWCRRVEWVATRVRVRVLVGVGCMGWLLRLRLRL